MECACRAYLARMEGGGTHTAANDIENLLCFMDFVQIGESNSISKVSDVCVCLTEQPVD